MSSRKGAFSRWTSEVMVEKKMLVDVDKNNLGVLVPVIIREGCNAGSFCTKYCLVVLW